MNIFNIVIYFLIIKLILLIVIYDNNIITFEKNTHTFEFERHVLDTTVSIISFGMLQVVKIYIYNKR